MNGVVGGYLTKIIEPFELDDIKDAYGGYEFSYIMKRGRDAIYNGRFTVEAPPKLDEQRESAAAAGKNGGGKALVRHSGKNGGGEVERSRRAAGRVRTAQRGDGGRGGVMGKRGEGERGWNRGGKGGGGSARGGGLTWGSPTMAPGQRNI